MSRHTSFLIAAQEWRYWGRSRLGAGAGLVMIVLTITSVIATAVNVERERVARLALQTAAKQTFESQPARHPHRMIHYGHYVFRAPAPLAVVDPGVDPYTGTAIFLEGHKQNSATFSPRYSGAQAGWFAQLTPALTYQLLIPLLLIVVGFSAISREREAKTDQLMFTSTVTPKQLWLGKSLALTALAAVTLAPLAAGVAFAWWRGENGLISVAFLLGYALYLLFWVAMISAASAWSARSDAALMSLIAVWLVVCIVLPRLAGSTADTIAPLHGKLASDLEIARASRSQGDGHNANDPAFAKLRAELLAQYDVDVVEQLPINFRGVVAAKAEAQLTNTLNQYAERRMTQQRSQTTLANLFSALSPSMAIMAYSTKTASTDLNQHQQFLRDAEAARFSFVQQLNDVHAHALSYADDINRSNDAHAERRTRVSAEHWRVLDEVPWQPDSVGRRLSASAPYLLALFLWVVGVAYLGLVAVKRLAWKVNE